MFKKYFIRMVLWLFVWMMFYSIVDKVKADLYYDTYAGTGAYPSFPGNGGSLTYPTKLSSGTVSQLNYNWGSGVVLDSGRNERVIVHFYGYITIPGTGSQDIQFYLYADDGVYMKLDDTVVINDWQEQGAGTWNYVSTDQTLTGGQTYYIDMWWYENGGDTAVKLYWDQTGSVALVPASTYSTTEPIPVSAPTGAQTNLRTSTRGITHSGNGIYITQIGDNLDLDIVQEGQDNFIAGTGTTVLSFSNAEIAGNYNTVDIEQRSDDNGLLFDLDGNHNNLTVSQGNSVSDGGGNRAIVGINGDYNDVSLTQKNGGLQNGQFADISVTGDSNFISSQQHNSDQMLFVDITGNDSTLYTNQKDSGSHFLDITLGSDQTLSVTQEGSGDHAATIALDGYESSLQLNQNSSTSQTYSIDQTCGNANGCSTTVVTQY